LICAPEGDLLKRPGYGRAITVGGSRKDWYLLPRPCRTEWGAAKGKSATTRKGGNSIQMITPILRRKSKIIAMIRSGWRIKETTVEGSR
jgi:hypothetical protein